MYTVGRRFKSTPTKVPTTTLSLPWWTSIVVQLQQWLAWNIEICILMLSKNTFSSSNYIVTRWHTCFNDDRLISSLYRHCSSFRLIPTSKWNRRVAWRTPNDRLIDRSMAEFSWNLAVFIHAVSEDLFDSKHSVCDSKRTSTIPIQSRDLVYRHVYSPQNWAE